MNERIHEKVTNFSSILTFLFSLSLSSMKSVVIRNFFSQLVDYTMAGMEDILGHTGNLKIRDK